MPLVVIYGEIAFEVGLNFILVEVDGGHHFLVGGFSWAADDHLLYLRGRGWYAVANRYFVYLAGLGKFAKEVVGDDAVFVASGFGHVVGVKPLALAGV